MSLHTPSLTCVCPSAKLSALVELLFELICCYLAVLCNAQARSHRTIIIYFWAVQRVGRIEKKRCRYDRSQLADTDEGFVEVCRVPVRSNPPGSYVKKWHLRFYWGAVMKRSLIAVLNPTRANQTWAFGLYPRVQ